jgi:hypothetical protein
LVVLLTLPYGVAEELNKDVSIVIQPPKYPIENRDTKIDFYIWNNGSFSFNGTLVYEFWSDKIRWKKTKVNITIKPKNYTVYSTIIKLPSPGLYWAKAEISDMRDRQITYTEYPFNVHSYSEAATIAGVVIGLLSLFAYLIYRR